MMTEGTDKKIEASVATSYKLSIVWKQVEEI